ncbi:hypothetical protein [Dyadobacter sp. CY356]|uniref:hypothetical protein n=1 Tax=Dyadobacter sp. CY356 TaxID=2906442 RepID=UPI001F27E855|nr:hypothetical protein [Dyadobacter sp. CY356]MCF0059510.1 hypothetical protein [Dyadobacter sp. CY356]
MSIDVFGVRYRPLALLADDFVLGSFMVLARLKMRSANLMSATLKFENTKPNSGDEY